MKLVSQHQKSMSAAIVSMVKNPLEHLLNILVIAMIVAILSSIFLISKNITLWEHGNVSFPKIMLYLNQNSTSSDVANIEAAINKSAKNIVVGYQFISKEDGLH